MSYRLHQMNLISSAFSMLEISCYPFDIILVLLQSKGDAPTKRNGETILSLVYAESLVTTSFIPWASDLSFPAALKIDSVKIQRRSAR